VRSLAEGQKGLISPYLTAFEAVRSARFIQRFALCLGFGTDFAKPKLSSRARQFRPSSQAIVVRAVTRRPFLLCVGEVCLEPESNP
jgi:hypothetical protein